MPTVDQLLHAAAQGQPRVPFWVLEKDYALNYVLAGLAQEQMLSDALVLKGGTALHKFYFADYRFSEDLDFSAVVRPADVDTAMQAAIAARDGRVEIVQCTTSFTLSVQLGIDGWPSTLPVCTVYNWNPATRDFEPRAMPSSRP
jgi:hypothetical protein